MPTKGNVPRGTFPFLFIPLPHQNTIHLEKTKHKPTTLLSWLILILLGVIWGTSYILIKKGLVAFSPEQVASLRMAITAISFLPFFIWHFHKIDWSKWKSLAVVGFAGSFIPAFLFATAQTKISSSLTGILSSLTPLFTLFVGMAFYKIKGTWTKITGVLLGLVGAVYLLIIERGLGDMEGIQYGGLVIIACLFYAISNNVIKTHLQNFPALAISTVSYLMVGAFAIAYLLYSGFLDVMWTNPQALSSLGYLAILAVMGTMAASVLFFKLIKDTNALFASTVSYLIPIVAIGWGMADGEAVSLWHWIGVATILAGVYVARK